MSEPWPPPTSPPLAAPGVGSTCIVQRTDDNWYAESIDDGFVMWTSIKEGAWRFATAEEAQAWIDATPMFWSDEVKRGATPLIVRVDA